MIDHIKQTIAQGDLDRQLFNEILKDDEGFPCGPDLYSRLKHVLYDLGTKNYEYLGTILKIFRINREWKTRLDIASGPNPDFCKHTDKLLEKVDQLVADSIERSKLSVKEDADFMQAENEAITAVRKAFAEKRNQQITAQQKQAESKQPVDPDDPSTYDRLSLAGGLENREKISKKSSEKRMLVKVKLPEKAELENQLLPILEKIKSLKIKRDATPDEAAWKDLKLSEDFFQDQAEKLQAQIQGLEQEISKLQAEIEQAEFRIRVLNCIVDARVAEEKEAVNYEKRAERARERARRSIQDREELLRLRANVNETFQQLTGSKKTLCRELCLMKDSEIFII